MSWSFSESRTFLKCQRRWYYDSVLAHWTQKDPRRWEAYLLSKMQSVSGNAGFVTRSFTGFEVSTRRGVCKVRCYPGSAHVFDACGA